MSNVNKQTPWSIAPSHYLTKPTQQSFQNQFSSPISTLLSARVFHTGFIYSRDTTNQLLKRSIYHDNIT